MKKYLYLLILIISLFSGNILRAYENLLYFENFDDYEGTLPPDWERIDTDGKGTTDKFVVQNGRVGLVSNNVNTIGDVLFGDKNWTNYKFSFDMISYSGSDRNVLFRWSDPENRMGFHISGNTLRIEKAIPQSEWSNPNNLIPFPSVDVTGKVPHNMLHQFEITVIDNRTIIHLKNDLVDEVLLDYTDPNEYKILKGSVGLRVGTGVVAPASVWFDNVRVTAIESESEGLALTHFSQNDPQWKDVEYDHAANTNPINQIFIKNWGCALTSAAMILDFHGFKYGPDGQETNPLTLNTYLKENNGYLASGAVKWGAFTKYAKDAKEAGNVSEDTKLLEFDYPNSFDIAQAKSDLEAQIPVILKLTQDDRDHFVVVNHIDDQDEIYINDPLDTEYSQSTISQKYPDRTITRVGRFVPSNTDLSYIWIYLDNLDVNMLVEYNGLRTGKDLEGEYSEIPNAVYFLEGPISNAEDFNTGFGADLPTQVFALPKPETGEYKISFSSNTTQTATVEFDLYDKDAEVWSSQIMTAISSGSSSDYQLTISDDFNLDQPELTLEGDYARFIKLVIYASNNQMITNNGTKNSILAQATASWLLHNKAPKAANQLLRNIEKTLNKSLGKSLTQTGHDLLYPELLALYQ